MYGDAVTVNGINPPMLTSHQSPFLNYFFLKEFTRFDLEEYFRLCHMRAHTGDLNKIVPIMHISEILN